MPRVVHFEISANDPEKVSAFYKDVFGWDINKWDGPVAYWLVGTGDDGTPGIDGGIFTPEPGQPSGTVNTIDVDDLDAYSAKVIGNGGAMVTAKTAIPSMGWFAYAKDVEGNVFGMMQRDESAGT